MKKIADYLSRHRTSLLIALLTSTLFISSRMSRIRLEQEAVTTALPVTHAEASAPVRAYISERDAAYQRDIAALTALVNQEDLDARTREAAADEMRALIRNHEGQIALEDALASTSLAPCAAVVSGGSITLVTAKAEITQEDSALVFMLCQAHTGVEPANVQILTAE